MKNFKELDKRKVSEVEDSISLSWESINKMHDAQVEKNKDKDTFVFYDGPAFANPMPLIRYIKSIYSNFLLNQGITG